MRSRLKAETRKEKDFLKKCDRKVRPASFGGFDAEIVHQLRDDCPKKADGCPSFPPIYETPSTRRAKMALLDDFFLADPEVIYRVNRTIRSVEKAREGYNNGLSGDSQVFL